MILFLYKNLEGFDIFFIDKLLGKVLQNSSLIIWDEWTMAHRAYIETLNTILRHKRSSNKVIGRITLIFSGYFRQTFCKIYEDEYRHEELLKRRKHRFPQKSSFWSEKYPNLTNIMPLIQILVKLWLKTWSLESIWM